MVFLGLLIGWLQTHLHVRLLLYIELVLDDRRNSFVFLHIPFDLLNLLGSYSIYRMFIGVRFLHLKMFDALSSSSMKCLVPKPKESAT